MQDLNTIRQGAVLTSLTIRKWGNSKLDKGASASIAASSGASPEFARVTKTLLSKQFIDPLNKLLNKARSDFYEVTLPWTDNGWRLLPVGKLNDLQQAIDNHKIDLDNLLRQSLIDYAYQVQNAQRELGTLFDPDDYPSTSEIAAKYSIEVQMMPVPSEGDFRLSVAGDVAEAIREQAREQYAACAARSMQHIWHSVGELLTLVHERLNSSDGRFTSIFPKLMDMVDGLDELNVGQDPELQRLQREAKRRLSALRDPKAIKTDEPARKQAAQDVKSVIDDFEGMWG